MANYYVSSVKYAAVTAYANLTLYSLGQIVRQLAAPAVNSERCFRCTTAGTSGVTEGAWALTKNATTTQGTAVFTECTGQEAFQGTTWAAPFARLNPAVLTAFSAAGDTIFVASNHAETQATSISLTLVGTVGSMQRILCVTVTANALPPVAADLTTGGTVTVTAGSSITLTSGSLYCYGLTFFASGAGTPFITLNDAATNYQIYDHCTFKFDQTANNTRLDIGVANNIVQTTTEFWNVTLDNAGPNTALAIRVKQGLFKWFGGSITSGVASLIVPYASAINSHGVELHGVDLSALTASQNIFTQPAAGNHGISRYDIVNCKLIANYPAGTVMSGTIQAPNYCDVDMITTHNTGQGAREEHYRYQGSIVADLANYRNGGASDGVSNKSWKMVTLSVSAHHSPLYAPDMYTWLPSAGSYTLTMFLANTSALTLTDKDFGFDYFWMGTSGVPLATFSTTMANALGAGVALTTDSVSAWAGLSSPIKQKIAVTLAVTEPGFVRIRPRLCRASTTAYVDPLVVVS